jgi:hypothetical protein
MKIHKITQLLVPLALLLTFGACDAFRNEAPTDYIESPKDITGVWRIIKASRNGSDITEAFDFTSFRLIFNSDRTYTVENRLPFPVKTAGTWSLDDPQYPFNLIFRENGSGQELISGLTYPVVNGKRQMNISFSPGCHSNIYTYVLEQTAGREAQ